MMTRSRLCALTGLIRVLICLAAALPHATWAQTLRGTVRDRERGSPVPLVTLTARGDAGTSVSALSGVDGQFSLTLPRPGVYRLDARRIGYAPATIDSVVVGRAGPTDVVVRMLVLATNLDTVSTVSRRGSALTPGRTFVARHLALKRGHIVSGFDILRSGLSLSEYLGKLDGLKLMSVGGSMPLVPGRNGMFLTSAWETKCLYARVDWVPLPFLLVTYGRESIDDLLRLDEIKAVEVYRTIREAPEEWRFDATVSMLYRRTNGSASYLLGHSGRPKIPSEALDEDWRRGFYTALVLDENKPIRPMKGIDAVNAWVSTGGRSNVIKLGSIANQGFIAPVCGFLQIWTNVAW